MAIHETNPLILWPLRVFILIGIGTVFMHHNEIQPYVDAAWERMKVNWFFECVYFETIYTIIVYTLVLVVAAIPDRIPYLDRYKIDKNAKVEHPTYGMLIREYFRYVAPLAVLDTFHVKKYVGVPTSVHDHKFKDWIQRTRALPQDSVPFLHMVFHIFGAIIIFDILFFIMHYTLHKNMYLYKTIHYEHHNHEDGVNGRVTNKNTMPETVALVLSANAGLRVLGSHPLSRFCFVPVFIWMIIENHSNYNFPYSYEKLMPHGLMGGSPYHHAHHATGARHYQPFFTYLDRAVRYLEGRRKLKSLQE